MEGDYVALCQRGAPGALPGGSGAVRTRYGGYCAYAVANGATAPGDPQVWRIVDGRLYLNVNKNIQSEWEKDIPGYIRSADANWPKLLKAE